MDASMLAPASLTYTAPCPGCGRDVTWAAWTGAAPDAALTLIVRCMRCETGHRARRALHVLSRAT